MKKKIIDHPFHKICYDYDETKAWTPRDEKLLNVYVQLLDSEHENRESAVALQQQFAELEKKVEALRKKLKPVERKINGIRKAADRLFAQINLGVPDTAVNFAAKMNQTAEAMNAYHKQITELEQELNELEERKSAYASEDDDPLWDRVGELIMTYAHDNRLATDLVSFGNDKQRFAHKVSYIGQMTEQALFYCNMVICNYDRLILQMKIQFEVWNEFTKRMLLIDYIMGMNADSGEAGLN